MVQPLTYLFAGIRTWLIEGPSAVPAFLLTGGVLFGAVFSMGDYTTTPISGSGRVIFGAGAAMLTLIMRQFGNTSYAVGFSILVMNTLTPILDFYIRPRVFSMPNGFRKRAVEMKVIERSRRFHTCLCSKLLTRLLLLLANVFVLVF
jgi:electron transport complex protein RnfD